MANVDTRTPLSPFTMRVLRELPMDPELPKPYMQLVADTGAASYYAPARAVVEIRDAFPEVPLIVVFGPNGGLLFTNDHDKVARFKEWSLNRCYTTVERLQSGVLEAQWQMLPANVADIARHQFENVLRELTMAGRL